MNRGTDSDTTLGSPLILSLSLFFFSSSSISGVVPTLPAGQVTRTNNASSSPTYREPIYRHMMSSFSVLYSSENLFSSVSLRKKNGVFL